MLKPERVTFSADDEKFRQLINNEEKDPYSRDSLVHYSTDFQGIQSTPSNCSPETTSLNELSRQAMSNNQDEKLSKFSENDQEIQTSSNPMIPSNDSSISNEDNLHQIDALALQQVSISPNINGSNVDQSNTSRTAPMADIQREIDRVRQMRYGRNYSSPTSALSTRVTLNPYFNSNNQIDLTAMTHSVQFSEPNDSIQRRLPFSSTYVTSIPESSIPLSTDQNLSSNQNPNHFMPIPSLDTSLEDREVFETFHSKSPSVPGIAIRQTTSRPQSRTISISDLDLLQSLQRNSSRQAFDNQSEHGTTYSGTSEELIFTEWDKERSLFQDYINSLRKEIQVLVQERADYQKQIQTVSNNLSEHRRIHTVQTPHDQSKIDLLQKSLEEKNQVLERLQKEYDHVKDKNSTLSRKVSDLRSEAKLQSGVVEELKQKIAELTVDVQNHLLIRRRLEISIGNLESDCKLIDNERLRLVNDVKQSETNRRETEKLLQKANVQIAEQGSAMELLRSDNIQIRSQLSTTQRRMLQEKQQIMDYLRQIENDLVEKEQLKQSQAILTKEFEQLKIQHHQDQQNLAKIDEERLKLLQMMETLDQTRNSVEQELDIYKSATKRLYNHFKVPFESIQSLDQLIPIIENRSRTEQISQARLHDVHLNRSASPFSNSDDDETTRQLRNQIEMLTAQLKESTEANLAWQLYQQNQYSILRDRLNLDDIEHASFEDIVQRIQNELSTLKDQLAELQRTNETKENVDQLKERMAQLETEHQQHLQALQQSLNENQAEVFAQNEIEFREKISTLTRQCEQLEQLNNHNQVHQQDQLRSFLTLFETIFTSDDENKSFDNLVQKLSAHIIKTSNERDTLVQRVQMLETLNNDLLSESTNDVETIKETYAETIRELNQQINQLTNVNETLTNELNTLREQNSHFATHPISRVDKSPSPTDDHHKKLMKSVHETRVHELNDDHENYNELQQTIVNLTEQCRQLEQANQAWQRYHQSLFEEFSNKLRTHIAFDEIPTNLEQVPDLILNQLERLKQLNDELRSDCSDQMISIKQENVDQTNKYEQQIQQLNQYIQHIQQEQADREKELLASVALQTTAASTASSDAELESLREELNILRVRCDDSEKANQAFQIYHEGMMNDLRQKMETFLGSEDVADELEHIPAAGLLDRMIEEIQQERDSFNRQLQQMQTDSNTRIQSIENANKSSIKNFEELILLKQIEYDELQTDYTQLQVKFAELSEVQRNASKSIEVVKAGSSERSIGSVPVHNIDEEKEREIQSLRDEITVLTIKCSQLEQANEAWSLHYKTQTENIVQVIQSALSLDETVTFDGLPQHIINHVDDGKRDFQEKYNRLEDSLRQQQSESIAAIETTKESYKTVIDQLNTELVTLKQNFAELSIEHETLKVKLDESNQRLNEVSIKQTTDTSTFDEVHPVSLQSSANFFDDTKDHEISQLKERMNDLVEQCTQLNSANQAWQEFYQTQVNIFIGKLSERFVIESNATLDQIAELIAYRFDQDHRDFNEKMESINKVLDEQLKEKLLHAREQFERELNEKQIVLDDLHQQLNESKQNIEHQRSASSDLFSNEQQNELIQLQLDYATLSEFFRKIEFEHGNWKQYEQEQIPIINELLSTEDKTSLYELLPELLTEFRRLKEVNLLNVENERKLVECLESKRTEFDQLRTDYQRLSQEKSELIENQNQIDNVTLSEKVVDLESQVNQLNLTNQAWQSFYENQISAMKHSLTNFLTFDDATQFEQIIELVVEKLSSLTAIENSQSTDIVQNELNELRQNLEQSQDEKQQLHERISNIEKEKHLLEESIREDRDAIDSLNRTLYQKSNENEELEKQISQSDTKIQSLTDENRVLVERINELENQATELQAERQSDRQLTDQLQSYPEGSDQSSANVLGNSIENGPADQEFEQLKRDFMILQTQMSQLEEANRAWGIYHQNQLNLFRELLDGWIPIDESFTLEQAAQQIIQELEQLVNSSNPSSNVVHTVDEEVLKQMNEKLIDVQQKLDEAHAENLQLSESCRNLEEREKQLSQNQKSTEDTERMLLLEEKNNYLESENTSLRDKLEEVEQRLSNLSAPEHIQRASVPREAVPIHNVDYTRDEEIRQLRLDLAAASNSCLQLEEANREWQKYHYDQIEVFRVNLQEQLPMIAQLENASLDMISQRISNYFVELKTERDDLMNQLHGLKDEIELYRHKERSPSIEIKRRNIARRSDERHMIEAQVHDVSLSRSAERPNSNTDDTQEFQQTIVNLTEQCQQLEQANQAWQIYYQSQVHGFISRLRGHVDFDETSINLEEIGNSVFNHIEQLKQLNDEHRSDALLPTETGNHHDQGLYSLKTSTSVEANPATRIHRGDFELKSEGSQMNSNPDYNWATWEQYQQSWHENLKRQLDSELAIDFDSDPNDLVKQIIDKIRDERSAFDQKYRDLENQYDQFRSDCSDQMISIKQENTDQTNKYEQQIQQLNQYIQHIQQEQADREKELLASVALQATAASTASSDAELESLREELNILRVRCDDSEKANQAFQMYHEGTMNDLRQKMETFLGSEDVADELEHIPAAGLLDRMIEEIQQERQRINQQYAELEKMRSELGSDVQQLNNESHELMKYNGIQPSDGYHEAVKQSSSMNNGEQLDKQTTDFECQVMLLLDNSNELNAVREELALTNLRADESMLKHQNDITDLSEILQQWINIPENATLRQIGEILNNDYQERQHRIQGLRENESQTVTTLDISEQETQTPLIVTVDQYTEVDEVVRKSEYIQTDSWQDLWANSLHKTLVDDGEYENGSLIDYIMEISLLTSDEAIDRLRSECEKVLSKQKVPSDMYENLNLNQYASASLFAMYQQHLAYEAQHLYDEASLRALKQGYELTHNEKLDNEEKFGSMEDQYRQKLSAVEKEFISLQQKYDDLLEQTELERLELKKSFDDTMEQYRLHESQMQSNMFVVLQENQQMRLELSQWQENYQALTGNGYNQLQMEYETLKRDFDEAINQNEYLKDVNSKMYQAQLQNKSTDSEGDIRSVNDVDVQCNFEEEIKVAANIESGWDVQQPFEELTQEQPITTELTNQFQDNIDELKNVIEELRIENEQLKDLNVELNQFKLKVLAQSSADDTHNINGSTSPILATHESSDEQMVSAPQLTSENQPDEVSPENQLDNQMTGENDWDDEMPIIETSDNEEVAVDANPHVETNALESQTLSEATGSSEKSDEILLKLGEAIRIIKAKIQNLLPEELEPVLESHQNIQNRLNHLIIGLNRLIEEYDHNQTRIEELQSALRETQDQIKTQATVSSDDSNHQSEYVMDENHPRIIELQSRLKQLEEELNLQEEQTAGIQEELNLMLSDRSKETEENQKALEQLIRTNSELIEEHGRKTAEYEQQIDRLQAELNTVNESNRNVDDPVVRPELEIQSLQDIIAQQADEIRDLTDRFFSASSATETEKQFEEEKNAMEQRLQEFENQIKDLSRERADLLEQLETKTSSESSTVDSQKQAKLNQKLKRALQNIKEKIQQIVNDRPDLFIDIGEETSQRLDHLISIVHRQSSLIVLLEEEKQKIREQVQQPNQEQLTSSATEDEENNAWSTDLFDNASTMKSSNEEEIGEVRSKLSQAEEECSRLQTCVNDLKSELEKILQDRNDTLAMYDEQCQALVRERDDLVEKSTFESMKHLQEIGDLKAQVEELKEISEQKALFKAEIEENEALRDEVGRQNQDLKAFQERYDNLVAMYESQYSSLQTLETDKQTLENQLKENENVISELKQQQLELLEKLDNRNSLPSQPSDTDKLMKINGKLKRALQTIKEKIQYAVTQNPDLFINVGEETVERLEHIISIVRDQKGFIDQLERERNNFEQQLADELEKSNNLRIIQDAPHEIPIQIVQPLTSEPNNRETEEEALVNTKNQQVVDFMQQMVQMREEYDSLQKNFDRTQQEYDLNIADQQNKISDYEDRLKSLSQEFDLQIIKHEQEMDRLESMIAQQNEEIQCLNTRLSDASSSNTARETAEMEKNVYENRIHDFESEIATLKRQREELLEKLEIKSSATTQSADSDKLLKMNTKLKRFLQTMKEKIQGVVAQHPSLFENVGEETNERLDHLISTVNDLVRRLDELRREHESARLAYQEEIEDLQKSLSSERDRNNREQSLTSSQSIPVALRSSSIQLQDQSDDQQHELSTVATSINQWDDWYTEPVKVDVERCDIDIQCDLIHEQMQSTLNERDAELEHKKTSRTETSTTPNDWDDQSSPIQLPDDVSLLPQTTNPTVSSDALLSDVQMKIRGILSDQDESNDFTGDLLEDLDCLSILMNKYRDEIQQLKCSVVQQSTDDQTQPLASSFVEENRQQIDLLIEERNEISQKLEELIEKSKADEEQWLETEKALNEKIQMYISEISALQTERNHIEENSLSNTKISDVNDQESQTDSETNSTANDSRVPRRVFEQEILAWSKENDQLKQGFKQIQTENNKLKELISKLERLGQDYSHEIDRLKQENQHLSALSYSSLQSVMQNDGSATSDTDICYLTLKCLTYEVAQRVSSNSNDVSTSNIQSHELLSTQNVTHTENILKSVRIQNQQMRRKLEIYSIQLKRIQVEVQVKTQELSVLKIELEKVRNNEIQYRLEVDRLKADHQCDQVQIQQLERELNDMKFNRTINDPNLNDNLRELLLLKEKELTALKDKLSYVQEAHQIELQEAIRTNQFSLDNVQRFEELEHRHQEKRKALESRLGQLCKIVKPLLENNESELTNSAIDVHQLQELVSATEAEEKVSSSLGSIRNCLGLLENQMKELQTNLIETHSRRLTPSKVKSTIEYSDPFSELNHRSDISSNMFPLIKIESNPISLDFTEAEVQLCLDDLIDDVIVRTIGN